MGIDFSNAKGFGDAKPAGWYPATFEKLESGTSKAGNPQLVVVSAVREGDFMGTKFYDYLPLDPEAQGSIKTKKFAEAFGYDTSDLDIDAIVEEQLGAEIWVRVNRRMGKDQDGEKRMENRPLQYSSEDPGEATPTKDDLDALLEKEDSGVSGAALAEKVKAGEKGAKGKAAPGKKNGARARA